MADYYCNTRTNYFRVKNEAEFRVLVSRVYSDEEDVRLWEDTNDGVTRFAFGCYGGISGLRDAKCDEDCPSFAEDSYDEFLSELQKLLPDDEAVIITEVGNEKLRYLTGTAIIVTAKSIKTISLDDYATATAREMLGDPDKYFDLCY